MHPIGTVQLSNQARDQLVSLKRKTGLRQWNELCRWGLCISLAEESPPTHINIVTDSSIEMSWPLFGGEHEALYLALLRIRCVQDGLPLDRQTLATQFKLHLHRGIAYLAGDRGLTTIGDLLSKIAPLTHDKEV